MPKIPQYTPGGTVSIPGPGSIPVARATANTFGGASGAGLMEFGQKLTGFAIGQLKSIEDAERKKREREAVALGISAEADAFADWTTKKTDLQTQYGKIDESGISASGIDYEKVFNRQKGVMTDLAEHSKKWIADRVALAPTPQAKAAIANKLGEYRLSTLKSTLKEEITEEKAVYTEVLKKSTQFDLGRMATDPANWVTYFKDAKTKILAGQASFLDPKEAFSQMKTLKTGTARVVSGQWFSDGGENFDSLDKIVSGKTGNQDLDDLLTGLGAEERLSVSKQISDKYFQEVRVDEIDRKNIDRQKEETTQNLLLKFYHPETDEKEQSDIAERLFAVGKISPTAYISMQQAMSGDEPITDHNTMLTAINMIDSKEITDVSGIMELGLDSRSVALVLPHLRGVRAADYREATKFLRAEIGIPEGFIFDNNTERRSEGQALAKLIKFYARNPTGDFFAKAEELASEYKAKQGPPDAAIKILEERRDAAANKGDLDSAGRLQEQINKLTGAK